MKIRLLIFFVFLQFFANSQVLNLPPRPVGALTGSQFVALVTNYSLTDRENEIYSQVLSGNVPDFQRNLIPVTNSQTISSTLYTYTYYVLPDYLAIGCDTNYFLCPMTPLLAQRIADAFNCTMPTRKMVNQIWTAATVHLAPSTIPPSPQMITIPVMSQHNDTVWEQRSAVLAAHPLGELVGGDKKDVVISNLIYGYTPGRVVIYGWHYLNGTPIQPLYNGHEETYADYSHGIRLVQMNMILNGSTTTVSSVLQSSTLNPLLSDEGSIAIPRYPVNLPTVSVPTSFSVSPVDPTSLQIIASPQAAVTHYLVQLSNDGVNFGSTLTLSSDSLQIDNLITDSIYFIRIAAVSSFDTSAYSEVLGVVPSNCNPKVLVVNGFDRASTGNTYNFIRQHGMAFHKNGFAFSSATNEAVVNGLLDLKSYRIVDYILGNESTAQETFSSSEQLQIEDYLDNGGYFFVSGAEIAWDLDHLGSTADKDFYHNYLKASYVNDAPNGQSGVYYQSQPSDTSIFAGLATFSFDNGTHGTFNVNYPDVLGAMNGSVHCLKYSGLTANYAGINYSGIFPGGTQAGKLVNLGIPFETIYPESARNSLMSYILNYFNVLSYTPEPIVTTPVTYCQNDVADSLVASGSNLLWYNVQTGGIGNFNAPVPSTTIAGTTFYYVTQNIDGCESQRAEILVNVKPQPALPVITQSGDSLLSGVLYGNQWSLNNILLAGDTNYYCIPLVSGSYSLIIEENGCYSDTSAVINIVLTGMNSDLPMETDLQLYPVPVSDQLHIEFIGDQPENYDVKIMNSSGQLVYVTELTGTAVINTANLSPGLYLVVVSGKSFMFTRSIIKQ
jgi:hypothetical protein